jgi:hypothetical protein
MHRIIFCFVRSQTGQLGLNLHKKRAMKRYNGSEGGGIYNVRISCLHHGIYMKKKNRETARK